MQGAKNLETAGDYFITRVEAAGNFDLGCTSDTRGDGDEVDSQIVLLSRQDVDSLYGLGFPFAADGPLEEGSFPLFFI